MPNYRYPMPEYERRNHMSRSGMSCSANRNSRDMARDSRGIERNCCEVSHRDCRNQGEMSCAVEDNYDSLSGMPLAMAYVPWQMWRRIYDVEKGFCCGTIFEELNKPFRGMGGAR